MSTANASVPPEKRQYTIPKYAWVILAVVFLAGIVEPMALYIMPPMLPTLSQVFLLSVAQAGFLMSMFSVIQLFFAYPAGLMISKIGLKNVALIALASEVIGTAIEATSTNATMLFAGRIIEGIGMAFIGVAGPTALALWFGKDKRGLVMGVWGTWVPLGATLILNLVPVLLRSYGWQGAFWFLTIFAAIVFVVYAVLFRLPKPHEIAPDLAEQPVVKAIDEKTNVFGNIIKNRELLLLVFGFLCWVAPSMALTTFAPTFLTEVRGYDLQTASFMTSLQMVVPIPIAFLIGMLSDRLGTRKKFLLFGMTLWFLLLFLPFNATGTLLWLFWIGMGICGATLPTSMWASVPEVAGKTPVELAMSTSLFTQALGFMIGPALMGILIQSFGYTTAGWFLVPVPLIGILLLSRLKLR